MGILGTAIILWLKNFMKAARWRRPSETRESADCAVMEFDLEIPSDIIGTVGLITMLRRIFGGDMDTDHPIFGYLGSQQDAGKPAQITVTVSIRRTHGELTRAGGGAPRR